MGIQQRNGNRRIAGGSRWMGQGGASDGMSPAVGLSRSVTVTQQKPGLTVTDQDKRERSVGKSRSVTPADQKTTLDVTNRDEQIRSDQTSQFVTSRPTFGPYLLQIETNQSSLTKDLNL